MHMYLTLLANLQELWTRMVYLDYITCLRCTILVRYPWNAHLSLLEDLQELWTRMVYLDYITCLRYAILVRNPWNAHVSDITSGLTRAVDQNGISRLHNMFEIYHSGPEPFKCTSVITRRLTRVVDQNGISPLYNMFEICHSGPETCHH